MLTSKQRAFLRKRVHSEEAIIHAGKSGVTPELVSAIDEALAARELIKIDLLNNCPEEPKNAAETVAGRTRSEVVQVIGKKIALYRASKDKPKIVLPALILALLLPLLPAGPAQGANAYVPITQTVEAAVVDVLDTDSLIARTPTGLALVRLVGIDPAASADAYESVSKRLLGETVVLTPDSAVPARGRWNAAYVNHKGASVNEQLLRGGQAKLRVTDKAAARYKELSAAESNARAARLGVWASVGLPAPVPYYGDKVNVNTASAARLTAALGQTTDILAAAIVNYRVLHPFDTVGELKFVPGMTKELYDKYAQRLAVCTNLLTANTEELLTLRGFTADTAKAVIEYRARANPAAPDGFVADGVLPSLLLTQNAPFVSLKDERKLAVAAPAATVNVNTASQLQLRGAGLSAVTAGRVTDSRQTGYALKSLRDLAAYSDVNWTADAMNYMADNLHIYTDVNAASDYELQSLFGEAPNPAAVAAMLASRPFADLAAVKTAVGADAFALIEPHVYAAPAPKPDEAYNGAAPATRLVNANMATVAQLKDIGLTEAQAAAVFRLNAQLQTPAGLPAIAKPAAKHLALYTNVNTAWDHELASLGDGFTPALIAAIKAYRQTQPFGTVDEFVAFCAAEGHTDAAYQARQFLAVR